MNPNESELEIIEVEDLLLRMGIASTQSNYDNEVIGSNHIQAEKDGKNNLGRKERKENLYLYRFDSCQLAL